MGRTSTNRATMDIRALRLALFVLLLVVVTHTSADANL